MLYHDDLKEVCDTLDLPRSGNKTELWERIMDEVEPLDMKIPIIDVKSIPESNNEDSSEGGLILPFEAYEGPRSYIFVSYSHEDKDLVYNEIKRLHNDGFNIWYDEGISPASIWVDEIAKAIKNCIIFLVFISPKAISSQFVNKEITFAITEKKNLLAVYIEKTKLESGIKLQIGNIQAINKYKMKDDIYYKKLKKALDRII